MNCNRGYTFLPEMFCRPHSMLNRNTEGNSLFLTCYGSIFIDDRVISTFNDQGCLLRSDTSSETVMAYIGIINVVTQCVVLERHQEPSINGLSLGHVYTEDYRPSSRGWVAYRFAPE